VILIPFAYSLTSTAVWIFRPFFCFREDGHTVKKGDYLAKIAKEKGVALQELLTLNKLTPSDNIYPGQQILVQ
jgi:hypothetical protein